MYSLPVRNDERKLDSKTAKLLLIKGIVILFKKCIYKIYTTVRNDEEKTNLVDPIITARSFFEHVEVVERLLGVKSIVYFMMRRS